MKHVLLIVAHNQFEILNKLISQFDNEPDFLIYIHVDLKSNITDEILQLLNRHVSVKKIVYKYNVNWGGRNLLRAMLYMCNIIIDDLSNEEFYVHTLSGVDILTRPISEFKAFFDSNNGRNFMENFSLPYHGWNNGGLDRLELYHPLDRWNVRCENGAKMYKRYIDRQKNKNVKRLLPQIQLYGGKSTLMKLLLKFYTPTSGMIAWGDYDARDYTAASIRNQTGIVMQDNFVFSDTIKQNIILGEPYDEERLNRAIDMACLREYVDSLPLGIHTRIGTEGNGVSGGEYRWRRHEHPFSYTGNNNGTLVPRMSHVACQR